MPNQEREYFYYKFKMRMSEYWFGGFLVIDDHHHYKRAKTGAQTARRL